MKNASEISQRLLRKGASFTAASCESLAAGILLGLGLGLGLVISRMVNRRK